MKRLALTLLLVVCVSVTGTIVNASGTSDLHVQRDIGIAPLRAGMSHHGQMHGMRTFGITFNRRTNQTAAQLHIPESAFSPATVNARDEGTLDNTVVDQTFFRSAHSTKYANLGFQSGYLEQAYWTAPGASTPTGFFYQGSIYSSSTAAANAWADGVATAESQFTNPKNTDCTSNAGGMRCAVLTFAAVLTINNTKIDNGFVQYVVLQYNQCTAEIAAAVDSGVFNSNMGQITSTILGSTGIFGNAIQILRNACGSNPPPTSQPTTTPPTTQPTTQPTATRTPTRTPTPIKTSTPPPASISFDIISLRIEQNGKKADWKQVRPPLKQLKTGSKVQFSLYYTVTSAPANQPIVVDITVRDNGKTVLTQRFSQDKGCSDCHLDAKNPADTYWFAMRPFTLKTTGNYSASVTLTIGSRSKQIGASIKAAPKVAPPPPPVAFSFNQLRLVNQGGQPTSRFKVGQSVGVVYQFTVRNVKTTVPLSVIRTYQYLSAGHGWVPVGHPVPEYSDTSNGAHTFKLFSVPNPTYKQQRVIVGITIGGSHAEKTATFAIQ